MTMPNGADGLSPNIALAYPVTDDGSLPEQKNNTQGVVETKLKADVQNSEGWKGAHSAGFAGLPNIPLPLAILAKVAEQITGLDIAGWVQSWFDNPVVDFLEGLVADASAAIFTVSVNIQNLFENIDFLDPLQDAAEGIFKGFVNAGNILGDIAAAAIEGLENFIATATANISTLFGNFSSFLSTIGQATMAAAGNLFNTVKGWADSAFGWFQDILNGFSLSNVGQWISSLLGTRNTANTASTNASTALENAASTDKELQRLRLDTENITAGSDFEGEHKWSSSGWNVVTDQAYAGTKSYKRIATDAGSTSANLNIGNVEAREGDQFYWRFWARRTADWDATDAKLRLATQDGDLWSGSSSGTFTPGALPADTWTLREGVTGAMPSGTTGMQMRLTAGGATAGAVWIDGIVVRRVKGVETVTGLPGYIATWTANFSTLFGNFSELLSNAVEGTIASLGSWISGAKTSITTFAGNFSTLLSNAAESTIAALGAAISTVKTNVATALGNWTTFLSNAAEGTIATVGTALANAKAWASEAIGNFTSILSGFSLPNIGQWISNLLGTRSTAQTADSNASTALTTSTNVRNAFRTRNQSSNLASDPDMATPEMWSQTETGTTFTGISTEQAYSGTTSLKITTSGTVTPLISLIRDAQGTRGLRVPVRPGERYEIKGMVKQMQEFTSGGRIRMNFAFYDSKNVLPGVADSATAPILVVDQWTEITHRATVPDGYDEMLARINFTSTPAAGDTYFVDRVSLREYTLLQGTVNRLWEAFTGNTAGSDQLDSVLKTVASAVKSTAETAFSNASTALGNFTTMLSNAAESTVAALGSWISGAKTSIGTFTSNFSTLLTNAAESTIAALGSAISTVKTNVSTALGNWTTFLSNAAESTIATVGTALANAKSWASEAIGNFTSILSGFSLPNIGQWISDLLGTKSTASTANTNASTASTNATLANSRIINSTAANMVTDPSFENIDLWNLTTGLAFNTTVRRGNSGRSIAMTGVSRTIYLLNGNSGTAAQRLTPASPGDRILVKAWVNKPAANVGTPGGLNMGFVPVDSAGASMTSVIRTVAQTSMATDTWEEWTYTGTVPPGAVAIRPYIQTSSNMPSADVFYVEDLYVQNQTLAVIAQSTADTANTTANAANKQVTALSLDPENLLAGSDFESDNYPWALNLTNKVLDATMSQSGTRSLKISTGATGVTYTGLPIDLKANEQLYAEFWVRRTADWSATDARLRLGNDSASSNTANLYFRQGEVPEIDTWVKKSMVTTPYPTGATRLIPSFTLTSVSGTAWIDNIVVRRVKGAEIITGLPSNISTWTTNFSTLFGNFTTMLSNAAESTVATLGSWISGAKTSIGTFAGNFTTLLTNAAESTIAALGSAISTVKTNVGTALGNWTTFLSNAVEGTVASLGSAFNTAKTRAADAINNFSDILTGFGLGSIGSWITNLLGTRSQAQTADTNANTAVGNFTTMLSNASETTVANFGTAFANAKTSIGTFTTNFSTLLSNAAESTIAALGSAIATVKTNVGTALGNWTTFLSNAAETTIANVGAALNNARTWASEAIGNFTSILSGFSLPNVGQWITDLLGTRSSAATAATNASTALGNTQNLIDNIFQGGGGAGTNNPVSVVLDTIGNIFGLGRDAGEAAAANAAALAALQAQQNGQNNGGNYATVDFSSLANASTPPSSFTKTTDTGTGSTQIVDGRFAWVRSGGGYALEMYRYNLKELATDYFEVSGVMPGRAMADPFTNGADGFIWLVGRMNAAGTQWVGAQFGYDEVRFGYVNGGSVQYPKGQLARSIPAGSILRVRGGTVGGIRVYQILIGETVVDSWTDSGALTAAGASNRWCGVGMEAGSRFDGSQNAPGNLSLWTMSDNQPVPVIGQGLSVYRNSTSNVAYADGDVQLPNGTFDMVEVQTSDFSGWNAATSTFTATVADFYTIDYCLRTTWVMTRSNALEPLLYVNGAIKRRGTRLMPPVGTSSSPSGSAWNVNGPFNICLTKTVYLNVGDTVRPGIGRLAGAGTGNIVGNANGDLTNMTIMRGKQ